jgi:hypothetical protein
MNIKVVSPVDKVFFDKLADLCQLSEDQRRFIRSITIKWNYQYVPNIEIEYLGFREFEEVEGEL